MQIERQTNIELCRIVAMLLVVMVHSGIVAFGDIKAYDESYWGLLTMESFAIVGVNVFVLISGYFSLTFNLKSIVKLVWICFFYAIISLMIALVLRLPVKLSSIFWVSDSIWYIATYIGLLCFSPLLNVFIAKMNKKQLRLFIVALIIFQTWYEYVPRRIHDFHNGYSILSFMILYMMARYVRIYGFPSIVKKYNIWIYVVFSTFIAICLIGAVTFRFHPRGVADLLLKYNNPLVIASSLGLFAFFAQKQIKTNYVINYIATSCIAVLLLHTSPYFSRYVVGLIHEIFNIYAGIFLVLIWGGVIAMEFMVSVLVDQIRLFIERKWLNNYLSRIDMKLE